MIDALGRGVWGSLLRLLPRSVREEFGGEMRNLCALRHAPLADASAARRAGFWAREIGGAFVAVLAAWGDAVRGRPVRGRGSMGNADEEIPMQRLMQDVRYAARHLLKSPVFTLGAVALLAVGIGTSTTVFTVVDALLFRPPPWEDVEEVVFVYQDSDDGVPSSSSYPATLDMARSDVFAAVAGISQDVVTWDAEGGPRELAIEYTNSDYMDVLGLSVQRGRWFGPEHDAPGAAPVAVVTHAAWQSRFGGDPDLVGRSIRLNGQPVTVIGIGPESLKGTYGPLVTDLWLSISATVVGGSFRVANLDRREDHWYDVRARLASGVTVQQAQAAMDALAASLAEAYPELNRGRDITVFAADEVRVHPSADGQLFAAGGILGALAATVLLLVCANLANLLLVRGIGRSGEMAVRRALGAGRGRVARLFLVEPLLLAGLGGGLGLLLTHWALRVLPSLPIPWPGGAVVEFGLDARVVTFSLALIAVTGVLFGLAPALRSARTDVALILREEQPSSSGGRGTARLRSLLVTVQVAASLVLVLGAGLLARSLAALQQADTGVDAERVAFVRTSFSQAGLDGEEARVALQELLDRARALPGVTAAGATSRLPAQFSGTTTTVVEGYTPPTGTGAVEMPFAAVSDEYFGTVGIPLLEGRLFTDDDVPDGATAVLVNEEAARRFWGGVDPVGRRLRGQGSETWNTVVGVVGTAPVNRIGEAPQPFMYFTTRQVGIGSPYILVRTDGPPEALLDPLRREVGQVRSTLTVTAQSTLTAHFGSALETPRLAASLLGGFSLLAVILAGLGIYGVVSFTVARRAPELGIRMALGAARGRVVRMVVREVALTVVVGLVLGVALAAPAANRLEGSLYGVSGLDPVTFAGALLFMVAVAAAAAWLPARRAARADPVRALRAS